MEIANKSEKLDYSCFAGRFFSPLIRKLNEWEERIHERYEIIKFMQKKY